VEIAMTRWRRTILIATLTTYVVGLGAVAGIAVERMRFDAERSRILGRYTRAVETLHARLMSLEAPAEGAREPAR
jgi:hypothetical protein